MYNAGLRIASVNNTPLAGLVKPAVIELLRGANPKTGCIDLVFNRDDAGFMYAKALKSAEDGQLPVFATPFNATYLVKSDTSQTGWAKEAIQMQSTSAKEFAPRVFQRMDTTAAAMFEDDGAQETNVSRLQRVLQGALWAQRSERSRALLAGLVKAREAVGTLFSLSLSLSLFLFLSLSLSFSLSFPGMP